MNNYQTMSDEELIHSIQENMDTCDDAFQELYRRYHRLAYAVAKRTLSNDSDAEDVLQETFIEIKRSIHQLKNPQYFRLWLYRIVSNKCKNLYRKRKFSLVDSENEYVHNLIHDERQDVNPEREMKFSSDRDMLLQFMRELPSGQSLVLELFYLEQRSIKEISEYLKLPEGTVKSRMSSGKLSLKQKITRYERMENTKLSFHSLDEAIMAAFLYETVKPIGVIPFWKSKLMSYKTIASITLSSVAICCSVLLLSGFHENETEVPASSFEQIQVDGFVLESCSDAYFYLLHHACCAEDIAQMQQEDLMKLKDVYELLKVSDGYHYHLLQDKGWTKAFEERIHG